jgi:hypothetical protein
MTARWRSLMMTPSEVYQTAGLTLRATYLRHGSERQLWVNEKMML